jgi:hypothetical protein
MRAEHGERDGDRQPRSTARDAGPLPRDRPSAPPAAAHGGS